MIFWVFSIPVCLLETHYQFFFPSVRFAYSRSSLPYVLFDYFLFRLFVFNYSGSGWHEDRSVYVFVLSKCYNNKSSIRFTYWKKNQHNSRNVFHKLVSDLFHHQCTKWLIVLNVTRKWCMTLLCDVKNAKLNDVKTPNEMTFPSDVKMRWQKCIIWGIH